jgi:putative phage-type endonuclease
MLNEMQTKNRESGIGASECAIVLGISPYCTPYELWLQKTGRREIDPILNESKLRLRNAHEQTIADEYANQKGLKLRKSNLTKFHKKYPHMLCHLDRVIIGQRKIVECKTSTSWMKSVWGEVGTDHVPMDYIAQVQHQYACTNYDEADIAVLIDIDDFRIYPIQRDESIIKSIEERIDHFWRYHILEDNPPEPTNRQDIKLMYPINNGTFIQADNDVLKIIDEINQAKLVIKSTEQVQSEKEIKLLDIIGNADGIKINDEVLVTYLADKNGKKTLRFKKRA